MTSPAQLYLFFREIPLSKGYFAIVDADDYDRLAQHYWSADKIDKRVYAMRRARGADGKYHKIYMHREIMDAQKGDEVDHRVGIGLDNRKQNLRFATRTQQRANEGPKCHNTSGGKGIRIMKRKSGRIVYLVRVTYKGREHHGGTFRSLEAAKVAHFELSKRLFGEFARSA